ncbi:hypothetical protein G7Z17_g2639 [Cylindrodendrum hubeiense]|uniref:Uncharacterized protein n=1 Tax=Cylindrodendrum hubeiense TaxID=595255 RepID=A0A9P5HDU0_9HYPO|nr:hypothetical protein G7Z17_g2639 [Cylindrodendrum hubeiense]
MWLRNFRLPPADIVVAECGLEFENNYLGNMLKAKFLFEARLIHKYLKGMLVAAPRYHLSLLHMTLAEWNDLQMRAVPYLADQEGDDHDVYCI